MDQASSTQGTQKQDGKKPDFRELRMQRNIMIAGDPNGMAVKVTNPLQRALMEISRDAGPVIDRLITGSFSTVVTYDAQALLNELKTAVYTLNSALSKAAAEIDYVRNQPSIFRSAEDDAKFREQLRERKRKNRRRAGGNGGEPRDETTQKAGEQEKSPEAKIGDVLSQSSEDVGSGQETARPVKKQKGAAVAG